MIMESPNLMEKNTLSGNLVNLFVLRDGGALGDTDDAISFHPASMPVRIYRVIASGACYNVFWI
jgi:hypothetical protein